jgi:hypothetical protein
MMGILARGYGYFEINSMSTLIKVRFTAWNDMNITQVRFYMDFSTGSPYIRSVVDIYEDETLKATSVEIGTTTSDSWVMYRFNSPVPIIANKTYDIVLRPTYVYSTSHYHRVNFITLYSSDFRKFITNTTDPNILGTTDVRCYYSTNGGSTWTEYSNNLFSFLIVDDTGMCYGNPYTHVGTIQIYGTNYVGQYIKITNTTKTINSVNVLGYRTGNPPNLVLEIKDSAGNLIASSSISSITIPTSMAFIVFPLQRINLNVGSEYIIYLKCENNGGDSSNCYNIYYPYIYTEYVANLGIHDTNIRFASWGMG